MVEKWHTIEVFAQRKELIKEAVFAHENGKYHLSVNALLPQVEGIITDWEFGLDLGEGAIPFRHDSKTKKFKDIALTLQSASPVYQRVTNSTLDFMLTGPLLSTFQRWKDEIDISFPGRHAISHGRYDEALYTEENSIKIFFLLDAIFQIIVARDVFCLMKISLPYTKSLLTIARHS